MSLNLVTVPKKYLIAAVAVLLVGLIGTGFIVARPSDASSEGTSSGLGTSLTGVGGMAAAVAAPVMPIRLAAPVKAYATPAYGLGHESEVWYQLGPEVTVPAGSTRYLHSVVTVGNIAPKATQVTTMINCRLPGAPTQNIMWKGGDNRTAYAVAGVNAYAGRASFTENFLIVTAPTTTAYVCRLEGVFHNHLVRSKGRITVMSPTYLEDQFGDLTVAAQKYPGAKRVLAPGGSIEGAAAAVQPSATAKYVNGYASLNVTVCHKFIARRCTSNYSGNSSTVRLILVADQLNANGTVCKRYVAPPLVQSPSKAMHHWKMNRTFIKVPVLRTKCTGTTIRFSSTVTNMRGNNFLIENNHQTGTGLFEVPLTAY